MYELTNVSKLFQQGSVTIAAVNDVTLSIAPGEFVAIEGSSGSGKSTMLQLLGGLDRPSSGSIFYGDRDLASLPDKDLADLRLRTFGFIFQQFNLIPTLNARENIEAALAPMKMTSSDRRAKALERLGEVGLSDRADHLPSQLSGGQQQRVAIARALVNDPAVILADEPTGNLDSRTGEEIIALLSSLSREYGQTVILVTHDQRVSAQAGRILQMTDGTVADADPPFAPVPGE